MIITKSLSLKQLGAAKLIREMRSHVGLTQEQLAIHLGVMYFFTNRCGNERDNSSPLVIAKIE